MIGRWRALPQSLRRFHKVVGPARAPKVSEVSVWLNIENHRGGLERIQGRVGDSLFDTLRNNQTKVGGYCTLSYEDFNLREKPVEPFAQPPDCGLCVVELGESWYRRAEIHPIEREQLESDLLFPVNHKVKRLSCCVTLEPWMNEMWVRIPCYIPSTDHQSRPDVITVTGV